MLASGTRVVAAQLEQITATILPKIQLFQGKKIFS